MGLNFRVIENPPLLPSHVEDDFKHDYNEGVSLNKLGEKYGINRTRIAKLCKELGLPPRENKVYTYCYHDSRNNAWRVYKKINCRQYYFGSYDSEEAAKKVVNHLKNNNWSKESLNELDL